MNKYVAFLETALLTFQVIFSLFTLNYRLPRYQQFDYANFFPEIISEKINQKSIVLTEAGRYGYFLKNNYLYDIVGLNTAFTAKNASSYSYIKSIDPDLIFIHTSITLNANFKPCNGDNSCEIQYDIIEKNFTNLTKQLIHENNLSSLSRTHAASISSLQFLKQHSEKYNIFIVNYLNKYVHLIAIKNDLNDINANDIKLGLDMAFKNKDT